MFSSNLSYLFGEGVSTERRKVGRFESWNVINIPTFEHPSRLGDASRLHNGVVNYLADLPTGGACAGAKLQAVRATNVAAYDASVVGGFYERVERIRGWHVAEVRAACCIETPAPGKRYYLAELGAGNIVARPELQAAHATGVA